MIDLFILETCPYCLKVINFMKENGIQYNKIDVSNSDNALKLLSIGGLDQVPFLYNEKTNDKIYDSDMIISYLKNYEQE